MIRISLLARTAKTLISALKYQYHMTDLLKRTYYDSNFIFYGPAMGLYIDKLIAEKFEQKIAIKLLLEQLKITDSRFEDIILFIEKNIDNIKQFKSISTIMVACFQAKSAKNQNFLMKMGQKGFQMLQQSKQQSLQSSSFTIARFLITLHQLVGLSRFSNESFNKIDYKIFKPLFLVYTIQLFWLENIQDQYDLPKNMLKQLDENQDLIPFIDYHHLVYSKKVIKSKTFWDIVSKLSLKIKHLPNNSSTQNSNNHNKFQSTIDVKVVQKMYEQYLNDMREKFV